MTTARLTTHIDAPPEVVFDFVCDIDRWPEWDAFADEIVRTSDSPLVAGSTYTEREGKDESHWRVVEFERPGRQRHVGTVPFLGEVSVDIELVPRDGGTDFVQAIDYRVMPRVRPLGRLIELAVVDRYARNGMRRTQQGAKALIEGSSTEH